jgi:hypothetical protein
MALFKMKLNFKKTLGLNKKIQRTQNKRGANLAEVAARAADFGRYREKNE